LLADQEVQTLLRVPTIPITTRHSPSLYPWQCATPLAVPGTLIGLDRLGDAAPFRFDAWELYAAGIITSPNMLVLGQIGTGKSALVKTYLHRQLQLGRRVAVLDPKGEYYGLARAAGLQHVLMRPGGRDRLNPLDVPAGCSEEEATRHRATLLAALAATGLGRDLSSEERAALSAIAARLNDGAVLPDVVHRLLSPDQALADELATTTSALGAAVRPTALELRRLLDGDLAGMLDTDSTVSLDATGPGVIVDVSAVFGTDAIGPVMTCVGSWLTRITATDAARRIIVVDEAWALLGKVATTRWLQSTAKLARSLGIQLILVTHRLSDLTSQADSGTEAARQAQGLLADTDIRVVHRQPTAERATVASLLGLTRPEAELATRLPAHRALWRMGRHVAVVDHVLATDELAIVDTDSRMRS
jgi:type IV secretory pathway VirB4 component